MGNSNYHISLSCRQCNNTFSDYYTAKRKFCSRECYWSSILKTSPRLGLTDKEKKRNWREKNKTAEKNKCKCGSFKTNRANLCKKCRVKEFSGENSPYYKGGYECKLRNARERILRKKIDGLHTEKEWGELKEKYRYTCLCCKKTEPDIKLTRDHIIPLSKGGTDKITNIQPLCIACNTRKFTKTIDFRYDRSSNFR